MASPTQKGWSQGQITAFMEGMVRLIDIFKNTKFPLLVTYGALLGTVRDKKLIPWDKDIDIFYLSKKHKIKDMLLEYDNEITPILEKHGWESKEIANTVGGKTRIMIGQHYIRDHGKMYFTNTPNVWFDLWSSWFDKDKAFNLPPCVYSVEGFGVSDILPPEQLECEGYSIPVPHNYTKFLVRSYGEDWRIPKQEKGKWCPYFQKTKIVILDTHLFDYKKIIDSIDHYDLTYMNLEDALKSINNLDIDAFYVPALPPREEKIKELITKAKKRKIIVGLVGDVNSKLTEALKENDAFWVR